MSKKAFLILLFFILFFGGLLRLYKLGEIPISLYWDEVAMLADARFVAETGLDMHGNHWLQAMYLSYGDFKLPVYIWLATLSVKLFGVNEFALRFPSFIAGFLSIVLGGLISTELFKYFYKSKDKYLKVLFLSTSFVISFSPWGILFSRTGFEGHLGQFFLGMAVLYTIFGLKRERFFNFKTILFLLISQFFAGVATYSYFSVRFVWLVIFPLLIVLMKYKKPKLAVLSVLSLGLYFLLLMPMFNNQYYQASNDFRLSTTSVLNVKDWAVESNILREKAGNDLMSRFFYHRYVLIANELAKNYSAHLSFNYLFITGDKNLRHGTGYHGLYLLSFLPFFISGLYFLFTKYKKILLFFSVWWLIALLPASVPETTPHALRSLNAFLAVSIILAVGFNEIIFELIKKRKTLLNCLAVFYFTLVIFSILNFSIFYFQQYPKISASNWQAGFKNLALEVDKRTSSVRYVWVNLSDNRYFLWQLAYGKVNFSDVQEHLKNRSTPEFINNVNYSTYNWDRLDELDHKIIILEDLEKYKLQLVERNFKPTWNQKISDHGNDFVLVGFGE